MTFRAPVAVNTSWTCRHALMKVAGAAGGREGEGQVLQGGVGRGGGGGGRIRRRGLPGRLAARLRRAHRVLVPLEAESRADDDQHGDEERDPVDDEDPATPAGAAGAR